MLSIDEAIAHARAVAETCEDEASKYDMSDSYESQVAYQEGKCGEEHEQLAEWLEELKMYRESSYGELYSMVYNKAIDDAKSVILQTIDNEILVDTLHSRLEHLKEQKK